MDLHYGAAVDVGFTVTRADPYYARRAVGVGKGRTRGRDQPHESNRRRRACQWLNTNSAEFSRAHRMSSVADCRVASFWEKAATATSISSVVGKRE